jgi:hypothetical protein
MMLKRALEKRVENRLETKHNLPRGYLSGLLFRAPEPHQYKRLAYDKAQDFYYKRLQNQVQASIDRFLPPAFELMAKHAQIQFSMVKEDENQIQIDPTYQYMGNRYSNNPTYQVPKKVTDCPPSPTASAPPHVCEALVHRRSGGSLNSNKSLDESS